MGVYRIYDTKGQSRQEIVKQLFKSQRLKADQGKEFLIDVDCDRIYYSCNNKLKFLRYFLDEYGEKGLEFRYSVNHCIDETYEQMKIYNDKEKLKE